MAVVTELLDAFPYEENVREIKRHEESLFKQPKLMGPVKLLEHELVRAVHFPVEFMPAKFSPPRGVYECDQIRLEWQQMNSFRQPFYHRNADVDELSYQICGERTLMTEYGSVELRPGDFSRIPVGVAHDNYGRAEIHLLIYIPAPVYDAGTLSRTAQVMLPPFEGWESKFVAEVMTECLGGPECDISASDVDETLLLEHGKDISPDLLLRVLRAEGKEGATEWMYKSKDVWVGNTVVSGSDPTIYYRHRKAQEIQCQIKGTRTLITQHGIIDLEPGDFINIPNGVAFTNVATSESLHITVLTSNPAPAKAEVVKVAQAATPEAVNKVREALQRDGN
ncbi:hypothetical protein B0J14DRAFT_489749 [Halenospora varia]|nr:hypothetical protein B0J14DRAFT_489749 [Halenospora varia]